MKKTLINHKFLFGILSLLFITITILGTLRIEYSFRAPGYNDNVERILIVESDYEQVGSFHTTSVIAFDKVTILQKLVGDLMPKVDIKEFPNYFADIDLKAVYSAHCRHRPVHRHASRGRRLATVSRSNRARPHH